MIAFLVLAGLASYTLTPIVRRWALRRGLVDTPNERTLHVGSVPRAGGIAFVLPFLVLLVFAWAVWDAIDKLAFGLLVGAGGVAIVAFLDDLRPRSAWLRLALWAPLLVASLAVYGGLPELNLGFATLRWGTLGSVLALIGGLWLVTLYNFMDGINGLAAGQAVFVAGAAVVLMALTGGPESDPTLLGALALTVAGFLVWNWRPGYIFMGDVGSAFLGATFAVFSLHTETTGPRQLPMLTWHILLMPFLVDATFTLIRRVVTGRQWRKPHREHAYQLAVLAGHSHARVASAVFALDVVLFGFAWWSVRHPTHLLACALGAFALVAVCWFATVRAWPARPETDLPG